ncbi:MAG: hypothetical protein R3345_03020, partial [Fulvivirga sp.]|nr:hypothetical protein [Fulvivirga sp.]
MSKPFKFLKKHYLLVTSIVLLIAIGITLQVYGKSIVKQLLQQYIQRETAGNYELTYTDLDYNLLSRRVTLHQVALLPKGNVPFDRSSYSIELKRMDVQLHEILSIYTENKLHIEGIDIIEPTVSLLSGLNAKDQITVDLGNLYLLISDYIEILEIDYFNLQSGTFIYKNTDAVFENIDFQLKSFILDSIDRPNEIFYADEIDLKLQKESFILPDSTHSFNFDRFRLSTADSILAFENVTIRPLENIQADSQTVYHIDIPLLELVGIDYHKAYHEDLLTLDSVKIESPEVDILSGRKEQEGKLRDLLAKLFRSHLINVFVINDGEVTYQKNSHKIKSTLNGNIYQLKLDSTVLKKNSTWFSEIEANLRDFSYIFEDSSTIATFDDLKASTFEQSLDIQNFDLNFNLNEKRNKLIFSSIDIDGVDIMAYMREGIIHASSIVLDEPVAGIGSEFGDPSSVTASYSPDDIYRHIASFASTIKADNLQVMQADLSNANTRLSKIDFTTQNFVLDSSVHRWSNITGRDQLSLHFAMTRGDFRIMGLADYTETYQHIHISDPVIAHAQIDTLQAKATAVYIYGLTLDDFLLNQYPIADSVLLWS